MNETDALRQIRNLCENTFWIVKAQDIKNILDQIEPTPEIDWIQSTNASATLHDAYALYLYRRLQNSNGSFTMEGLAADLAAITTRWLDTHQMTP